MQWIGITGSWRASCPELEEDVARTVSTELERGNGIVAGGALGVDYIATELALKFAPDGSRVKVLLPTTLERYASHYRKRADERVIKTEQAEKLISQLEALREAGSLVESPDESEVNEHTYYLRNTEVVRASDEMLAFQVNGSAGVQDSINKARARGIPVTVFTYIVTPA